MKVICSLLIPLLALLGGAPGFAQTTYPTKPVRIIVGFVPGSATDITARIFAQKLSEAWSVPVTVENIPGAGGSVRGGRGAKAAADRDTLYWGPQRARTP